MARRLAKHLFGREDALVKLDMSEFAGRPRRFQARGRARRLRRLPRGLQTYGRHPQASAVVLRRIEKATPSKTLLQLPRGRAAHGRDRDAPSPSATPTSSLHLEYRQRPAGRQAPRLRRVGRGWLRIDGLRLRCANACARNSSTVRPRGRLPATRGRPAPTDPGSANWPRSSNA